MDLTDTYKTFHKNKFLLEDDGTFSKITHISRHKESIKTIKIEISSCILSDHNERYLCNLYVKSKGNYRKQWKQITHDE